MTRILAVTAVSLFVAHTASAQTQCSSITTSGVCAQTEYCLWQMGTCSDRCSTQTSAGTCAQRSTDCVWTGSSCVYTCRQKTTQATCDATSVCTWSGGACGNKRFWNYDPDGDQSALKSPYGMVASCTTCHSDPPDPVARCSAQATADACGSLSYCNWTGVACAHTNAPATPIIAAPNAGSGLFDWLRFTPAPSATPASPGLQTASWLGRTSYYSPGKTKAEAMAIRANDGTMPPGAAPNEYPWSSDSITRSWNKWTSGGMLPGYCPPASATDVTHYTGCASTFQPQVAMTCSHNLTFENILPFFKDYCSACHGPSQSNYPNWEDKNTVLAHQGAADGDLGRILTRLYLPSGHARVMPPSGPLYDDPTPPALLDEVTQYLECNTGN